MEESLEQTSRKINDSTEKLKKCKKNIKAHVQKLKDMREALIKNKLSTNMMVKEGYIDTVDEYTEMINGIKISMSITNCPETPAPVNPAIEFTQMNSAAVAAAVFGSAHFLRRRMGDRKIPPPTPIKPLIKPIIAPMGIAIEALGKAKISDS